MADETRIQVLKEPERNPETDSFMWLFRSGEDGLPPIVLYHYTETRARYNAVDFLDGFSDGYLETDGYQGYNNRKRQTMRQSLKSTPPIIGDVASCIRPEDYLTMA